MLILRDINSILAAVSKNFNWWQFSQTQTARRFWKSGQLSTLRECFTAISTNFTHLSWFSEWRSQHICNTRDNLTKEPRHVTWFHLSAQFPCLALVRKCVWLATTRRTSRSNASSFLPRSCKLFWSKRSSLATVSTSKCSCPFPANVMWPLQTEASVLHGIQQMYRPMRSIHFSSPANFWYRSQSSSLVYDKGRSTYRQPPFLWWCLPFFTGVHS